MSSDKKHKREREIQLECDTHIKDIRLKLEQQLRCLELKMEGQCAVVSEVQEFFRRRADAEQEYSKQLDRIARTFQSKQKGDNQKKKDMVPMYSLSSCMQNLVNVTKHQSRDHSVLSDIYGNSMQSRLQDIIDNHRRMFGNCSKTVVSSHEELFKVLRELQTGMKQYHTSNGEAYDAEGKLKHAQEQRNKLERQVDKSSKKLKNMEKLVEKKQEKYTGHRLKSVKARNEYLLTLAASNAATTKYFDEDVSLVIDCMDFGYHNALQRSMLQYVSCLENLRTSNQASLDSVNKCVQELDFNKDKQLFLKINSAIFTAPKQLPHKKEQLDISTEDDSVKEDLHHRYQQAHNRLSGLKVENEETWKSVEEVDKNLMDMLNAHDYDVTSAFKTDSPSSPIKISAQPEDKVKRLGTEAYYFEKFSKYLYDSNLSARIHSKYTVLKVALGPEFLRMVGNTMTLPRPSSMAPRARPKRVGKAPLVGQPKVFGCVLEDYIEITSEAIPRVMESCIRAVNLYGMRHEGVFRISGLHAEILEIKAAFEKGEDPLADIADANSMNSIAAVLKCFFRELQEPIFPAHMFDEFVETSRAENDSLGKMKKLVYTLSSPRIVVLRYLFAFLSHLSQFSDENFMYPYNLAVCFGPALLPVPSDKDQVVFQNNVNDIIKMIIINWDVIFSTDDPPGPLYERIVTDTMHSSNTENTDDEQSDDEESELIEAVAAYDFDGRSSQELSFKKDDVLILYNKKTSDWWEGAHNGTEGLIPDKYIHLKSAGMSLSSADCSLKRKGANSLTRSAGSSPRVANKSASLPRTGISYPTAS